MKLNFISPKLHVASISLSNSIESTKMPVALIFLAFVEKPQDFWLISFLGLIINRLPAFSFFYRPSCAIQSVQDSRGQSTTHAWATHNACPERGTQIWWQGHQGAAQCWSGDPTRDQVTKQKDALHTTIFASKKKKMLFLGPSLQLWCLPWEKRITTDFLHGTSRMTLVSNFSPYYFFP